MIGWWEKLEAVTCFTETRIWEAQTWNGLDWDGPRLTSGELCLMIVRISVTVPGGHITSHFKTALFSSRNSAPNCGCWLGSACRTFKNLQPNIFLNLLQLWKKETN